MASGQLIYRRFLGGALVALPGGMDAKPKLQHHDITDKVIDAFFATYNELAGFPEFVLRRAMAIAIRDAGLSVDEEKPLPVWFRGYQIVKFKADLVVASAVIVEVKARPEIDPFNKPQVLHFLKATDLEVGLLVNFGRRPEFTRVVYEQARKGPRLASPRQQADGEKPPSSATTSGSAEPNLS